MKQWLVRINGDAFDLEQLAKLFRYPEVTIVKDQGDYYLRSTDFSTAAGAEDVLEMAGGIVSRMNGATGLLFNEFGPLTVDNVVELHDNGSRTIYARATASMRSRTSLVELKMIDANGNVDTPVSPHPLEIVIRAEERSPAVENALRFYRIGNWMSLYKVFEIVRDNAGDIVKKGWITKTTLKRFTQTAQSSAALGDAARHAGRQYIPPSDPMTLPEAKAAIGGVLRSWLQIA